MTILIWRWNPMIDGFLRPFHIGVALNKSFIFPQLKMLRKTNNLFCKRTHAQNEHRFTFSEAMKVHMSRIQSFFKLKMLRHVQIQIVASYKMSQKTAVPFFTNKNGTQKFFSIKTLAPISWKKHFYWKELLCTVCVCKKWDCRFLRHLACHNLNLCVPENC